MQKCVAELQEEYTAATGTAYGKGWGEEKKGEEENALQVSRPKCAFGRFKTTNSRTSQQERLDERNACPRVT
jgi:hypothetical protein